MNKTLNIRPGVWTVSIPTTLYTNVNLHACSVQVFEFRYQVKFLLEKLATHCSSIASIVQYIM